MNINNVLTSIAALVFVLCLIALASMLAKKYGNGRFGKIGEIKVKRLAVKEILNIDGKNKVAIIARDGTEHLIAFSDSKIELIEKI